MSYTYSTFAQLKTSLSQQLSDTGKVFWTDAELGILLNSALREWNAISRMFRDRGIFATNATDTFYDLRDILENGSLEMILAPTVTDVQLLQQGKLMLMEPNPDDNTSFSDGISVEDFNDGFVRRRNQFLLQTGLIISQPATQIINAGRVTIADDSVIDIRRASWRTLSDVVTTLFREDEFASSSFSPRWPQSASTPRRYSIYPDPLLTIQLIPPPADIGTLLLQTISSGAVLDDFTPYILWGVLADICSSPGPSSDPLRASYAEQRYQEGVIVAQQAVTVMQAYINGAPVTTASVFDFDSFKPLWMTVTGTPKAIGLLGSNLLAVCPRANGIYSVTVDVVRNAPKLVNATDTLPIGREYLTLIINYAAHLATFKQGGSEFQQSWGDYDAFVKGAMEYNNRMNGQNLFFETLVDRAQREEKQVPLREEAVA